MFAQLLCTLSHTIVVVVVVVAIYGYKKYIFHRHNTDPKPLWEC